MLKYGGGASLAKAGFIGVVLAILIIVVGLQPERLTAYATSLTYKALFTEAGGIVAGNDVTLSGIRIGKVTDVGLDNGDALVAFTIKSRYPLGSESTAHIKTGTLLGERVLTLESAGGGKLSRTEAIPVSRTSSPYSLSDAIGELTTNTAGTDTQQLNQSLDTLSTTLNGIAPRLGPTFDGLTRLSKSLNSRDETLDDLLKTASDVTGILSERSQQVNSLILNANDLLGVLVERRQAIVDLLVNTSAVSKQLIGLVADNEKELAPTLERLNRVNEVLVRNRDNLGKAIPGAAKYQTTLSEAVSSGFYYTAFVPNFEAPQLLQPFLDYVFGFRRGPFGAGAPPTTPQTGPRAELPLPYNKIPGGSR
jgi:phospholipid/cholesterol/gamma-HCH transport system substrate-binding protein